MVTIGTYVFGADPQYEFDADDGLLKGFDGDHPAIWDGQVSDRWSALYAALEASEDDEEMVPGVLPDGRFALIGMTVSDHPFAVEEPD